MKQSIVELLAKIENQSLVRENDGKMLLYYYNQITKRSDKYSTCTSCFKEWVRMCRRYVGMPVNDQITKLTAKERLQECKNCEHLFGINCKKCLCFVHVKTKFKNEKCPIGKW